MKSLTTLLPFLERGFLKRRQTAEWAARLLTEQARARLEAQVNDMAAVAEMQGSAGWAVVMRELEAEKQRAMTALLTMDVHRFAGKRGIEARGMVAEMDRLSRLVDTLIARGATAQAALFADERSKRTGATVNRV